MRVVKKTAKIIGIILLVLVLAYAGVVIDLYSSIGRFPVEGAVYPEASIRTLIWPTVGYPAIVAPGAPLEVEVDPAGVVKPEGGPGGISRWQAYIRPARSALGSLTYRLQSARAWRGPSRRWPRGTRHGGRGNNVWHLKFTVPPDALPELYDLSIRGEAGGSLIQDRQRHAVSVREAENNGFTYISLADIHVHRRNISGWKQPQTDKGILENGRPVFFENAIDQVNLIRPDFVVLLGDFVRAQHEPGDYQVEFEEFFRALDRFEVPVFAIPGNHDLYYNEVDGARVWEENLGPIYYSFDVAGSHFACVDTSEWPAEARMVMKKFGLFVYPRKWQGQVLSAGHEADVSTYGGQLAWLRDDLASHQGSKLRVMLLHHDPFVPGGRGVAFDNEVFAGAFVLGGGGSGRDALRTLASEYRVDMVMSGHLHSDSVGQAPWANGGGQTVYANQTCVYFDQGGERYKYPGYRLVTVEDGKIASFAYLDGVHSFPFYDGSSLTGMTDLDALERPAISAVRTGPSTPGLPLVGWRVENYLAAPVELRGLIAVAEGGPLDEKVTGGQVYRVVEVPGYPGRVVIYVKATVGKGVPGAGATEPGIPCQATVEVPFAVPASVLP